MKTSAIVLLISGLLIETAGFMADRTDVFSFVVPLIAHEYTAGMQGVRTLESTKSLDPESLGFKEAAEIFKDLLKQQNPGKPIDRINVLRFTLGRTSIGLGSLGASFNRELKVTLSNGQEIDWRLDALVTSFEEIRQSRLTATAVCIFFLGILSQIVGFLVENRARRERFG